MLSRNQIRQTALQYLYGASQSPEITGEQEEGIWDILMEPFRADYCKLRAKAVSGHLTRDYPDKLRLFVTRARETAEKLQHDPLTLPVRDQLHDLLNKEGEFNAALLQLKKALHDDPANDRKTLSAACDAVQELNTALMQMRGRLLDSLRDFPVYNSIWSPLISACGKLQEINDRINCIIHQDGRPSLAEVKKVVEAGRRGETLQGSENTGRRNTAPPGRTGLRHQRHPGKLLPGTRQHHGPRHPAPGRLRTAPSEKPSRSCRHFGSHPAGGTLLLRGFPPVCQRRACRHRQNGASLLTHIPSRLMAGFFKKLLTKFSRGTRIDWDELEADLVTADIGIRRAMNIVDQLRESRGLDAENLVESTREVIRQAFPATPPSLPGSSGGLSPCHPRGGRQRHRKNHLRRQTGPSAAKTGRQGASGRRGYLPAAAVEQLQSWAEKLSLPLYKGAPGQDPASVCYEAHAPGHREGCQYLICDTAGRLHTRHNLMEELSKIRRTLAKQDASAPHYTMLVVDATTGANALAQAREFHKATPLDAVIITKMDGSGKGGVAVAIMDEMQISPAFLGTGEQADDFETFNRDRYVDSLL